MYLEYVKSAISSIKSNKGRSFLTMLGIIIGIAAVLTVLIIGDGMKATVNGEMDSIGATTISVTLDDTKTDKGFTKEQLDLIENNISDIDGVSPGLQYGGQLMMGDKTFDAIVNGETPASGMSGQVEMIHGRFLIKSDVDEAKKVVVLSQTAAKKLFGYENVVGNFLEVSAYGATDEYVVVGVRKDNTLDTAYSSFFDEPSFIVTMPYTSMLDLYMIDMESNVHGFTIYTDSEYKDQVLSKTRSVVENVMGLRGENAVKISSGYGFDETTNTILNIITTVVAVIAAISLLVGGIGVMNIMTVSVTERTREIGIRKSLGARTSSILTQFLAEASILTFTGGLIGLLLGLAISYLICKIIDFAFIVNPVLVVIVVLISTAIGLFFGIYPAKRAAALDPIEALRTE